MLKSLRLVLGIFLISLSKSLSAQIRYTSMEAAMAVPAAQVEELSLSGVTRIIKVQFYNQLEVANANSFTTDENGNESLETYEVRIIIGKLPVKYINARNIFTGIANTRLLCME